MILLVGALLGYLQISAPGGPVTPSGEWRQTDLRGIEVTSGGACARLWIEERGYLVEPIGAGRFGGAYRNTIRAMPLSASSFAPSCRFEGPAQSSVANQTRLWQVLVTVQGERDWRVRAEPGPGSGDLRAFSTEEFETTLTARNGTLVDGSGQQSRNLTFHRPAQESIRGRKLLEDTLRRLYAGGCLEVMAALTQRADGIAEVCSLRRQMSDAQGSLIAITVDDEVPFDRVPAALLHPANQTDGLTDQQGVLFAFTSIFEASRMAGSAILFGEGEHWRVVMLWF